MDERRLADGGFKQRPALQLLFESPNRPKLRQACRKAVPGRASGEMSFRRASLCLHQHQWL